MSFSSVNNNTKNISLIFAYDISKSPSKYVTRNTNETNLAAKINLACPSAHSDQLSKPAAIYKLEN